VGQRDGVEDALDQPEFARWLGGVGLLRVGAGEAEVGQGPPGAGVAAAGLEVGLLAEAARAVDEALPPGVGELEAHGGGASAAAGVCAGVVEALLGVEALDAGEVEAARQGEVGVGGGVGVALGLGGLEAVGPGLEQVGVEVLGVGLVAAVVEVFAAHDPGGVGKGPERLLAAAGADALAQVLAGRPDLEAVVVLQPVGDLWEQVHGDRWEGRQRLELAT